MEEMLYKVNEEVKISWEKINENINIKFMKKVGGLKLILHWGIFKKYPITEWNRPKISCLPLKTYKYKYDSAALETEFITDKDMETIEMNLNKNEGMGLSFVFYRPFGDVWYNNKEKDFQIFFNGQENIKYNMCITLSKFGKNSISYNSDNNENDEKMKKEILEHTNIANFKEKFKNDRNFQELNNLKEIHTDVIISICKLSKNQLDSRGNRCDNWGINEKRGNMPYDPPIGWIGIGLNVWDKYDNGNNTWIGMINCPREWCVAYHGVGNMQVSNQVKDITGRIISDNFKSGRGQAHECCDDKYHPGKKVGTGVYCTPNIKTAEEYSGVSEINGQKYKTVLMVRVRPDAIRCCREHSYAKDYWVINGTNDEIRPYRILYKKV